MNNDFTNENFEGFLKQSADGLRMRPSDSVWKNIEKKMKRRRRRVFFTSGLFLLTASIFGYFVIENTKPVPEPQTTATTSNKAVDEGNTVHNTAPVTENKTFSKPHAAGIITAQKNKVISPLTVATLFGNDVAAPNAVVAGNELSGNPVITNTFTTTPVDEYTPAEENKEAQKQQLATLKNEAPLLTIESVYNTYKPKMRHRKTELQFFFTPTISYRKLSENKSYLRSASAQNSATFNAAIQQDVNNVVTHKPDLGLELGMAAKYAVSKNIKLRTGLQFNMNRYDIKAYNDVPELATIALNNRATGLDSLNTVSNHRNFNGTETDWLQNIYFQVSTPIGVEVKLRGDDNVQFGIATTIQPTYIIGDRAYLISTNYKNYSEVPWLTRRFNVNTSLETFVAYSTGKLKWQVGPQVRYQLLSSFVTKYPVKENLFDFGLKVGVSLNKK